MAGYEKLLDLMMLSREDQARFWEALKYLWEDLRRMEAKLDYTNWSVRTLRSEMDWVHHDLWIIKKSKTTINNPTNVTVKNWFFKRDWKELFYVLAILASTLWYLIVQTLIYIQENLW